MVEEVPLGPPQRRRVEVVYRPVVAPEATVSRALHEQPVQTHLAEVIVVTTPITIDPYRDLNRETGGIDDGHYLREAQRQWLSRHAQPARVIRRPSSSAEESEPVKPKIRPRAIIHIPDSLRRDRKTNPNGPAKPEGIEKVDWPSMVMVR